MEWTIKSEVLSKRTKLWYNIPIQKRKDDSMHIFRKNEKKLDDFVVYNLELKSENPICLQFAGTKKISHSDEKLPGYQYTLNGRTYTDMSSFDVKDRENITDDIYISEDIYGSKVLCVFNAIPTFDSGDREWDSRMIEYLMFDGKDINLVVMRGGYKIANLTFYTKLLNADLELKPYLKKLSFPVEKVMWKEND